MGSQSHLDNTPERQPAQRDLPHAIACGDDHQSRSSRVSSDRRSRGRSFAMLADGVAAHMLGRARQAGNVEFPHDAFQDGSDALAFGPSRCFEIHDGRLVRVNTVPIVQDFEYSQRMTVCCRQDRKRQPFGALVCRIVPLELEVFDEVGYDLLVDLFPRTQNGQPSVGGKRLERSSRRKSSLLTLHHSSVHSAGKRHSKEVCRLLSVKSS